MSQPHTNSEINGGIHGPVVQSGSIGKVEQHFHPSGDNSTRWVFGAVPPRAGAFQDRRIRAELTGSSSRYSSDRSGEGTTVLTGTGTGTGSRVVSGLGGVGKTQLAAEYARTLWSNSDLDVLMWVGATSRDAILSAYGRAATAMGGPDTADRWLEWLVATDKRWLVVLDDLQDPADLRGLWPPHTPTGRVLVTTRRRDASLRADGRRMIEVDLFTPDESLAFLTQRLNTRPAQVVGAESLAEELGHLPVALAQAAAYIADRVSLTCASYLTRWRARRTLSDLLPDAGGLPDEHRATVATTWALSTELADTLAPTGLARPLLEMASLLDPNGIPEALFTASATLVHLSAALGAEVDADTATDALSCLHRLSLIIHDPDSPHRAVRIHALVQRATREPMQVDHRAALSHVAADALVEIWPEIERDTDFASLLRSNTDSLHTNADTLLWKRGVHPVVFQAGTSLGTAGQYSAAVDYYGQLAVMAKERLGADHPDTLAARGILAWWNGTAGDAQGAAAAYEVLVADSERVLGVDHPSTVKTRGNLAWWRGAIGDVAGAVRVFERVLADRENTLGADHPDTVKARSNLANWRGAEGDAAGAVVVFERVLVDNERLYGVDHPNTLKARSNLANWRGEAGCSSSAAIAMEQVLADSQRVLGSDHPSTLAAGNNLARWRGKSGDVVNAVVALERVLADSERVLGFDHPYTVDTRINLDFWRGAAQAANAKSRRRLR